MGAFVFNRALAELKAQELEAMYGQKFIAEWRTSGVPSPEWYDHLIDLYLLRKQLNPMWMERGVFAVQVMRQGDCVLDLCCGDGFYAKTFYSHIVSEVVAIDRSPGALDQARACHSAQNVTYLDKDARDQVIDARKFDVIVMNMAIEHFTEDEITLLLSRVNLWLAPGGVFCGCTIQGSGALRNKHHLHEFASLLELSAFMHQTFPVVWTLQTQHSADRVNYYWRCAMEEGSTRLAMFLKT